MEIEVEPWRVRAVTGGTDLAVHIRPEHRFKPFQAFWGMRTRERAAGVGNIQAMREMTGVAGQLIDPAELLD